MYVHSELHTQGKELKEVLSIRRTMPEDEVRLVCVQVARALDHLHSKRLVHRDVSPRNILVEEATSRAWLIDLGLAVDLGVEEEEGKGGEGAVGMAGTLGYMPPESLRGQAAGSSGDMWALGTVMYESLFGFSPFLPHELHNQAASVQFPEPDWGLDSSAEARDVMSSLLAMDATRRMYAAELLAHSWATPAVTAKIDALFAQETADRAIEPAAGAGAGAAGSEDGAGVGVGAGQSAGGDEGGDDSWEHGNVLAVDLLGGTFVGGADTAHKLPCATLLPRSTSRDEEMSSMPEMSSVPLLGGEPACPRALTQAGVPAFGALGTCVCVCVCARARARVCVWRGG